MKHVNVRKDLIVLLALCSVGTVSAVPFSFSITGTLNRSTDSYNLNGATAEIILAADTSDTPTDGPHSLPGRTWNNFDVFTMTVNVTNRPGGAADLLGLTRTDWARTDNYFAPASENDELTFDARMWNPSDTGEFELYTDIINFDFGTQDFFAGTTPPGDLSFFSSLGSNLAPAQLVGDVSILINRSYSYTLTDVAVSNSLATVPAPGTLLLAGLGVGCLSRLRRRGTS